ncbi:MAG: hypothetical protein ACM3L9_10125 [Deltaproteobacteria bacterium]
MRFVRRLLGTFPAARAGAFTALLVAAASPAAAQYEAGGGFAFDLSAIAIGGNRNAPQATSPFTIAIGDSASALHFNSAAFGASAATQFDNQQAFGTASNTYTMAGLASEASRTAQGAPTHLVTSNASGDLAAYSFSELGVASSQDIANLREDVNSAFRRIDENTEGIAVAVAMGGNLVLPAGHNFGISANWGQYDGRHALSATSAMRLNSNFTLNGALGVGLDTNKVGSRVGAAFTR